MMNQTTAAQSLILQILVQAIQDLGDPEEGGIAGFDWLCGPTCDAYLVMLGMDEPMRWKFRLYLLLGLVDVAKLFAPVLGGTRFGFRSALDTAAAERWQSWPRIESQTLGR